jgi:hypothetical protein
MKRSTLEGTQIILLDDNLYKIPKIHFQILAELVGYENLFRSKEFNPFRFQYWKLL